MQVLYRFRSEKRLSKIETERPSMPLWELKAEIASLRHLTLHDYHLVFYIENEKEPVTDNYATIYANSSVVIERVPNYMHVGYKEALEKTKKEEELKEENSRISVANPMSGKIPPAAYVCYRCGKKGHYIQNCPTNSNKQYDSQKIKKPTGIPKMFLVPAEEAGSSAVLLNEEGRLVKAQPQTKEFRKHFEKGRVRGKTPEALVCPKCKELLTDAVRLECKHVVCECCEGGKCPVCGKRSEGSKPDKKIRRRIEEFLETQKM